MQLCVRDEIVQGFFCRGGTTHELAYRSQVVEAGVSAYQHPEMRASGLPDGCAEQMGGLVEVQALLPVSDECIQVDVGGLEYADRVAAQGTDNLRKALHRASPHLAGIAEYQRGAGRGQRMLSHGGGGSWLHEMTLPAVSCFGTDVRP
ncbi:hypothetical protein D9M69_459950 [compost metagenome]